jgi:DNA recombination protein RmuC
MLIAIIILGAVNAILLFLLFLLLKKSGTNKEDNSTLLIKQDITTLTESVHQLKDGIQKQLNERLDKSNEQIIKQFQQSAGIIKDVTEKLVTLEKTNQQVGNIAGELRVLQNVLTNPKQRGVLGEYYLSQVLENVLPPDSFQLQYKFKDGEIVDAVIKLDGKILPVDSKFSLENYNRLVGETDKPLKDSYVKAFKTDLKNRIDETAKYIRPSEGTMDYAFMFIPSEAIYYDLLINKVGASGTSARDLLEYAFKEKKVIIVSPTTFMAYLQTVMQGLRALHIEEQAKDIQVNIGKLARHLGGYKSFMEKLGNSLGTTVNHYNNATKEFKKVDTDVYKISGEDIRSDALLIDRPTAEDD